MPDRPRVAGVRFRNAGKIFYFHTAGMRLDPGEYVVVETTRGPEIARVVIAPDQVVVNELGDEPLKPVLRLATDDDILRADAQKDRAKEVLPEARSLAEEARFPAHIDGAEFTLDGKRLTLSFTTEERVDYRDFIRRASERFGVKVDMRQLGSRDRAKLAGGYGVCGRELCCASWLTTFPSISIRMAKDQELPLNPQKISGLCGRLLCCLSYEDEGYREMRKTLPKLGQRCSTPTGEGKVIGVNILRRQVTLLVESQRVDVEDRDLGTVVRWDASSKSAAPPPSISRAAAIEQGLIEATPEDLEPAGAVQEPDWITQQAAPRGDPGTGRGRLPGGGPRRVVPPRREEPAKREPSQPGTAGRQRGRGPGGEQRRDGQGQPRGPRTDTPPGPPAGRVFQRSSEAPPPPERRPQPPPGAPSTPSDPGSSGRRRRGRRGRGGGGSTPAE